MHKLTICGLEYRVVYATGDDVPELIENEGWCCTRLNTIYVRAQMPRSRMQDTLVHEVLHAFLAASGVDHFLEASLGDSDDYEQFEETLIRLVTPALRQLVADNGAELLRVPVSAVAVATPASAERRRAKKSRKR